MGKMSYVYYFVPHTLLSGLMFYYFSKDYYHLRSRNFYYFTSSSYLYLVVAWCGVHFFFVLCKFCWGSFLNSYVRFNFHISPYVFYCFMFFIFWAFFKFFEKKKKKKKKKS